MICWHPQLTMHLHISYMAARFDFYNKAASKNHSPRNFCTPLHSNWLLNVRNGDVWLKIVVTYVMLKMVCIPAETNDCWKANVYIKQMAFHLNKTWDFRVQVFIFVISFQRNYTKWGVLSWDIKNIWLNVMYVTFVFRTHKNYVKSSRLPPFWSKIQLWSLLHII